MLRIVTLAEWVLLAMLEVGPIFSKYLSHLSLGAQSEDIGQEKNLIQNPHIVYLCIAVQLL